MNSPLVSAMRRSGRCHRRKLKNSILLPAGWPAEIHHTSICQNWEIQACDRWQEFARLYYCVRSAWRRYVSANNVLRIFLSQGWSGVTGDHLPDIPDGFSLGSAHAEWCFRNCLHFGVWPLYTNRILKYSDAAVSSADSSLLSSFQNVRCHSHISKTSVSIAEEKKKSVSNSAQIGRQCASF